MPDRVLVTGGAGYVGAALVPRLLAAGHRVRVLDLYLYGEDALEGVADHPGLEQVRGDIRDRPLLADAMAGCDSVIHLACISNDACFELDPVVGRSINFEAFEPLVDAAREAGVRRFVYASTCSVYGVSDAPEVTEDHPLVPLTDYNLYKGLCEPILLSRQAPDFTTVVIRPATVCGPSPRQRLDLTVNTLAAQAWHLGRITVFGGEQERPNIHIHDMVRLYETLLELPADKIAGRTFNAGHQNLRVKEIAEIVRDVVRTLAPDRPAVGIVTTPSEDRRSYHISSARIARELGFVPRKGVADAVRDLIAAFKAGLVPKAIDDPRYYNVRCLRAIQGDLVRA